MQEKIKGKKETKAQRKKIGRKCRRGNEKQERKKVISQGTETKHKEIKMKDTNSA